MRKNIGRLLATRSATSAVEFALVLPLLLTLLLGCFEISRFLRYSRHLAGAADTWANMVSQQTYAGHWDLVNAALSMKHTFRESTNDALNNGGSVEDWWGYLGYQISTVDFQPTEAGCTTNCSYQAQILWFWPNYGPSLHRVCGHLTGAPVGAAPSASTIPSALFGPGSVVVVDLVYQYKPLIGSRFIAPTTIIKQAFYPPRFSPEVPPVPGGELIVCPMSIVG